MAGTVTTVEKTAQLVKAVMFTWVSSAGGAADATTTGYYDGIVLAAYFDPDAAGTQPTDQYDVTIVAADDDTTVDVLNGYGANLTNAATVNTCSTPLAGGVGIGVVANSRLTLAVTNAGNAKGGIVRVYIQ